MPLTKKGKKIKAAMTKEYGAKKAEKVFYASKNKGVIKGVERNQRKGLSGGKKYGPPPKKGPNPQGIKIKPRKKPNSVR